MLDNNQCPVTSAEILSIMLTGGFHPMDDVDLESFAGVEGDGYVAEINDCVVVADHMSGSLVVQVSTVDGAWWTMEINPRLSGER